MNPDNRYVSYLDGLRGYAILLVLAGHFELLKIFFARFGVTVFFFVSGFLITKLLIYEFNKHNRIDLPAFYLRRLFRLYPALIVMIGIACLILLAYGFRIVIPDVLSGLFYFTNYYLAYFKPYVPDNYLLVSNILWSLSVEEHFYLIFPLLFALFFARKKQFLNILVLLLPIFLLIRIGTCLTHAPKEYFIINYFTTHSRGDSILYGCVSALLIYQFNVKWYLKALQSQLFFFGGVVLLLFALVFRQEFFQSTFAYSFFGAGLFFVVPSFSFVNSRGIIKRIVDNPVTVYIGKLSYSLYLFHWISLKLGNLIFEHKNWQWYLFVVPMSFILAWLSYNYVEKPFLALRKRFGSNVRLAAS
ncbi:MAG TPA: acyltransferase [Puia sp.]|jgi:peptidoglycan/LPS O-acetylase OafA/YrhL|nr:acyltransferase [Puia sp.]